MKRPLFLAMLLVMTFLAWRIGAVAMWMMYATFRIALGLFLLLVIGFLGWIGCKLYVWKSGRLQRTGR